MLGDDGGDRVGRSIPVATGTVLTINTKEKKLYHGGDEPVDVAQSFTPQKRSLRRRWFVCRRIWQEVQTFAAGVLGINCRPYLPQLKRSHQRQGLTAVEKIFNRNAVVGRRVRYCTPIRRARAGQHRWVSGQTGLMTSGFCAMAATVISPVVDGYYQSGCHRFSVWTQKRRRIFPN